MWVYPDRLTIRQILELNDSVRLTDLYLAIYDQLDNATYKIGVLDLIGGSEEVSDGGTISDTTGTVLISTGSVALPSAAANTNRVLYIKKTSRGGSVEITSDDGIDDYGNSYTFGTGKLDCRRLVCDGTQWWIT